MLTADGMVSEVHRWAGGTDSPPCSGIGVAADSVDGGSYQYDARHQMIRDDLYQYDYDGSGNRVARRSAGLGSLIDSLSYQPRSNRVYQKFADTRQLSKTYWHQEDGALYNETSVSQSADRRYYHNALGEMTGHRWVSGWAYNPEFDVLYPVWAGLATGCKYDALGRRVNVCGSGGGWLAFDGNNVVRDGPNNWRYIPGPGLDDPLMGMFAVGGEYRKHYYLTDGRGRHLAFTDSLGTNYMEPAGGVEHQTYYQNGGNQAGSVENSHGFDNARQASANTPQLAYYRNRYYDQQTGRFLQEDPIGIAGGVNLYQFAGNNPAAYTDPFGLCPEPEKKDNTVCIAFFIKRDQAQGLKGDNRDFSARSDPSQSRIYMHVDVNNRSASVVQNPSCTVQDVCRGPRQDNDINVTFNDNGGFNVSVDARSSITAGPAINANIQFTPNGQGGFSASGSRDAFPSLEAYQWRGGQLVGQPILQRLEKSPYHLFPFMRNDRF